MQTHPDSGFLIQNLLLQVIQMHIKGLEAREEISQWKPGKLAGSSSMLKDHETLKWKVAPAIVEVTERVWCDSSELCESLSLTSLTPFKEQVLKHLSSLSQKRKCEKNVKDLEMGIETTADLCSRILGMAQKTLSIAPQPPELSDSRGEWIFNCLWLGYLTTL